MISWWFDGSNRGTHVGMLIFATVLVLLTLIGMTSSHEMNRLVIVKRYLHLDRLEVNEDVYMSVISILYNNVLGHV